MLKKSQLYLMKKWMLLLLVFHFNLLFVISAPHLGTQMNFKQPNGTYVTVKIFGDEFYSRMESLDGYTLIKDSLNGWISYARLSPDGNKLISTGIKYTGMQLKKSLNLSKGLDIPVEQRRVIIKKSREELYKSLTETDKKLKALDLSSPTTVKGLVVLIKFPDESSTISKSEITNFFNQTSGYTNAVNTNGSVYEYFYEVSGGIIKYTNIVVGYMTAQNNKSYYEALSMSNATKELLLEAEDYLDDINFNFSSVTKDDNGKVLATNLFFVGSGTGGLHGHAVFSSAAPNLGRSQICGMGSNLVLRTVCHENGHVLFRWPDLYDIDYTSRGLGNYCLMAYGGSDPNPVPPNGALRYLDGWENIIDLESTNCGENISILSNDLTSYKYSNQNNPEEYYLIQSVYKTDRYQYFPGSGMVIFHVDDLERLGLNYANTDEDGTASKHYTVAVVQSDNQYHLENKVNLGEQTDLYYSGLRTTFSPNTAPGSEWWDDTESGLTISNISAAGWTMNFKYSGSCRSTGAIVPYIAGFEDTSYENFWNMSSSNSYGRIRTTSSYSPKSGSKHLTMDVTTNGHYAINSAELKLDLQNSQDATLSFWWKEFGDETHSYDGVYFSDDGGSSYAKIMNLPGSSYSDQVWRFMETSTISYLASQYGLELTNNFVIKFQQYDNYAITMDGFAFDDIEVTGSYIGIDVPYFTDFEIPVSNDYWKFYTTRGDGFEFQKDPDAYSGQNVLKYDQYYTTCHAEARLHVNLNQNKNVVLEFWVKSDYTYIEESEDGVYFSDDGGATFTQVLAYEDLTFQQNVWQKVNLSIDQLAASHNLSLNKNFVIRFDKHFSYSDANISVDDVRIFHPGDEYRDAYTLNTVSNTNPCTGTIYSNAKYVTSDKTEYCYNTENNDIWFKTFIPISGNVNIKTCAGNVSDGVLNIYRVSSSGHLSHIACNDDYNSDKMPQVKIRNREPGEEIAVRFWSKTGEGNFRIIASEPFYDYPCSAFNLDVTETYYNLTNQGATSSGVADPGCAYYAGNDVWAVVEVPVGGNLIIEADNASGRDIDGGMAVYSGESCGALHLLACDDESGNHNMPKIVLNNQTPGERLYIRFWNNSNEHSLGAFKLRAYQPINNTPCTAHNLDVTGKFNFSKKSMTGATTSGISSPPCGGYAGYDLWYKVLVPSNGKIVLETRYTNSSDNYAMAVYNGSCSSPTLIACDDNSGNGNMPKISLTGRSFNETLYVRIWKYNNSSSYSNEFYISAYSPDNNVPCNALDLNVTSVYNKEYFNADLSDGSIYTGVSFSCYAAYKDEWYSVMTPSSGKLTVDVSLNNDEGGLALAAYLGDGCGNLSLINCAYDDDKTTLKLNVNTYPNEEIFIRYWSEQAYSYSIAAYENPSMNVPCEPLVITIPIELTEDLSDKSNSGIPSPMCAESYYNDIWFKTKMPSNGKIIVEAIQKPGSPFDYGALEIFKGNCSNPVRVECNEAGMPKIELSGRTDLADQDILIRLSSLYSSDIGEFILKVTDNPILNTPVYNENEIVTDIDYINKVLTNIFPNPAKNSITVTFGGNEQRYLMIFNTLGENMYSNIIENNESIDISYLCDGIYFIQLLDTNKKVKPEIIKLVVK